MKATDLTAIKKVSQITRAFYSNSLNNNYCQKDFDLHKRRYSLKKLRSAAMTMSSASAKSILITTLIGISIVTISMIIKEMIILKSIQ